MKKEQHVPDWNKDGVWESVKEKLHQKKKRRILFWWLGSATSVVILFGLLFLFNSDNSVQTLDSSIVNEKETSVGNPRDIDQKVAEVDLGKRSIKEQQIEEIENEYNPEDESFLVQGKIKSTSATSQSIINAISETSVNKPITSNLNSTSPNRIDEIESVIYDQSSQSNFIATAETIFKLKIGSEAASVVDSTKKDGVVNNPTVTEKLYVVDDLPGLPLVLLEHNSKRHKLRRTIINGLSMSLNSQINAPSTLVWIESGLSFGDKFIDNTTMESMHSVQFRFIQTNAVGVQRFLNKNWSLKVGLAYQTIYEKYEYLASTTIEEQVFSEAGVVYSLLDGIEYTEAGIATLRTTSSREIIHNNFIHRLSLPIEVAYTFKSKKWSLEPSIGLRFQFYEKFDGILARAGSHNFNVDQINELFYSKDLNLGFVGALKFQYDIFERGSLGLRFNFEKDNIFGLNKTEFYNEYRTVGIQLGYCHLLF